MSYPFQDADPSWKLFADYAIYVWWMIWNAHDNKTIDMVGTRLLRVQTELVNTLDLTAPQRVELGTLFTNTIQKMTGLVIAVMCRHEWEEAELELFHNSLAIAKYLAEINSIRYPVSVTKQLLYRHNEMITNLCLAKRGDRGEHELIAQFDAWFGHVISFANYFKSHCYLLLDDERLDDLRDLRLDERVDDLRDDDLRVDGLRERDDDLCVDDLRERIDGLRVDDLRVDLRVDDLRVDDLRVDDLRVDDLRDDDLRDDDLRVDDLRDDDLRVDGLGDVRRGSSPRALDPYVSRASLYVIQPEDSS